MRALASRSADDTSGTMPVADDVIPSFSSQGTGTRLPDVAAPGVHVQSLRVPGSFIDATAAAFVSGAAALLTQKDQLPSIVLAGCYG